VSASNHDIAERLEKIDYALGIFCDALIDLKRQQQELAARISFIAPTQGDITREVEEFIDKSLAA
jgi:hypothetical protein